MGVRNIQLERDAAVIESRAVADTDEILVMTASGVVIRTLVSEIRITGRGTKGVRIMRLDAGDRVIGVAVVEPETDNGKEPPAVEEKIGTGSDTKAQTPPEVTPVPEAGPKLPEERPPRIRLRNPQEAYKDY
jgi:DNA gyrase/topoisomerase IV subunit A